MKVLRVGGWRWGGRGCGWEGVWVAGGGAGVGMEGVDATSGRTCRNIRERRGEVKERKPGKERKTMKTSPGDPGFPGMDPVSPVSLGPQNPKESPLGTRGFPRRIPYPPCPWDTHVMTHSKIRGENPRTFKSLLAWTPPPFKCLFALEMFLQCKVQWSNGQQQRHEG